MDHMGILVPIFAVAIPLVAVTGRVIVQPIVNAIARVGDREDRRSADQGTVERLARMEAQLAMMEQNLNRVVEAQDFQARLLAGAPAAQAPAPRA
jgi:hypothetical protein